MAEVKIYRDRNYQICLATNLMVMMMVAIIVPAFPKTIEALGITEGSVGLLITAFTLPSLIFGPLGGILADRLGRKKTLVTALFFYGVFGGACAFAPDFKTLLILRILQGVGSAPLTSIAIAVIGDIFSGQKRAEAMSLNTTVMYVGYIIFPLIGGALAGLSWNYPFLPFLICVPLAVIAMFFLHNPEPHSEQSLKEYLRDAIRYIKSLKVLWLFSATVITYVLLYGAYLVYFTILLESRFHTSPFTIGIFIAILGIFVVIASFQVGRLSKRFSLVSIIIVAFVIYAVAVAIVPAMSNVWLCLLPTVLFGVAHGLNLPSLQIIAASVTPFEHRASFMAVQGIMIMVGMTIGPLIMSLVFSLTSLNVVFLIAAVIALIIPVMAVPIGRKKLTAP